MKIMKSFVALAALALAVPSFAVAQGSAKPTVAVLYFSNGAIGKSHEELEPLTKGIADLMIGELAVNAGIKVVERDNIQKLLDEQNLTKANLTDAATAVKIGKLLNAHYMVTGGFVTDGKGRMVLTVRCFKVETSEIVFPSPTAKDAKVDGKTENFMDMITTLAAKTNRGLALPEIPVKVGEARKEAAKKVPYEAIALYSAALEAQDSGKTAEAVTLYNKALDKFPAFDQAKVARDKLTKKG
jgi:curli biogenesis system outer membrane secretion channel CsgG